MWSLYNTAFMFNFPDPADCGYEGCNFDGKQVTAKNSKVFGDDMAKYGYTFELLGALMRSAATDMDALKAANDNWPKSSA